MAYDKKKLLACIHNNLNIKHAFLLIKHVAICTYSIYYN